MPKPATTNFLHSLVAVILGNLIYFSVSRFLPPAARHNTLHIDLGIVVDFWFCLVILGIIKTVAYYRRKAKLHRQ